MEKEDIPGAYLGLTYANNVWVDYDGVDWVDYYSGRSRRRRSSPTSRKPSSKATGPQERFSPWFLHCQSNGWESEYCHGTTKATTKATTPPTTTPSTTASTPTKPATTVPAGKSFAIDATHNCHRLFRHRPWIVVQSS